MQYKNAAALRGFTIVELLIVIVVIAILAAITIVAYNGITSTATENILKSDLSSGAKQLQLAKVSNGVYPGNTDSLQKSSDTNFAYTYNNTAQAFCLSASSPKLVGKSFYITNDGTIQEGSCILPTPTTMQAMTAAYCATMAVYTGSNSSAIITLTDSRGGTTRSYDIAKLADNRCWMLSNLKLGSTTGPTTLTPGDSNVASNFTLPQVTIPSSTSYNIPQAVGPVPGDTGAGTTNYGYLYNWPAATAGETQSTKPAGSSDASYSLCPSGWRLPSGNATGEYALLNAKMNNSGATAPSTNGGSGYYQKWQYTGPFKGVFSGYWSDDFLGQGSLGGFWSRSLSDAGVAFASSPNVYSTSVSPGSGNYRIYGLAVRCLLN